MRETFWSGDKIEMLKDLRAGGLSCGQIGRAMGVSRNAVIGKMTRLNLPRHSVIGEVRREFGTAPRVQRTKPLPLVTEALSPIGEIETLLANGKCKFIAGDTKIPGWQMCGHPAMHGRSWCQAHYSVVFDISATKASSIRYVKRQTAIAHDVEAA